MSLDNSSKGILNNPPLGSLLQHRDGRRGLEETTLSSPYREEETGLAVTSTSLPHSPEAREYLEGGQNYSPPQIPPASLLPSPFSSQEADKIPPEFVGKSPYMKKSAVQFYKTSLCKFYVEGKCRKGHKCTHAHCPDELLPKPNLQKIRMCRALLQTGQCLERGTTCRFAHDIYEVQGSNAFFRTKLCEFHKNGFCKLGENCRYAHGEEELQWHLKAARNWRLAQRREEGGDEGRDSSLTQSRIHPQTTPSPVQKQCVPPSSLRPSLAGAGQAQSTLHNPSFAVSSALAGLQQQQNFLGLSGLSGVSMPPFPLSSLSVPLYAPQLSVPVNFQQLSHASHLGGQMQGSLFLQGQ